MNDKRIGLYNTDGSVGQWPQTDINGAAYVRPCARTGLDAEHFVILPTNFRDMALLETLKAQYAPKAAAAQVEEAAPMADEAAAPETADEKPARRQRVQ